MTNFPILSSYKLIRILNKIGFKVIRQKGSHAVLRHKDGRSAIIPIHKGRDLDYGLLRKILKDLRISKDSFLKLLSS